jgi:hypothetical protein
MPITSLSEKDIELLQTRGSEHIDPKNSKFAYVGQKFGENLNDFVQVFIYDINNTFLESSIIDKADYILEGDGAIKLKTGTILRKLGYDRGRYSVKYKFLRKLAGDYKSVLVDSTGKVYNPPEGILVGENIRIDPIGKIFTLLTEEEEPKELFVREFKYFLHEISPSRTEIRLAPQDIDNGKYLKDFYNLQKETKKVMSDGTSDANLKFVGEGMLGDSREIEFVNSDAEFTPDMIGGTLMINGAFLIRFDALQSSLTSLGEISNTFEIVGSEDNPINTITPSFFVSSTDGADYRSGNKMFDDIKKAVADGTIAGRGFMARFQVQATNSKLNDLGIDPNSYEAVSKVIDTLNPVKIKAGDTIELSSNSIRPSAGTHYYWQFGGWDHDRTGSWWSRSSVYSPVTTDDVEIISTQGDADGLRVNGIDLKTIKIRVPNQGVRVSVRLTLKNDVGQEESIFLPACIEAN